MARTRGASQAWERPGLVHVDDGVAGPAPIASAPEPPRHREVIGYRLDANTLHRSLEAYDLALLLDKIIEGGLSLEVSPEEYRTNISPNLRVHFRAVLED